MTSRERLLTTLRGGVPDCVPVAPDFSNMIPARRTGRPFWDLYLYKNPPIWEAYLDSAAHFGIDVLMDGYFPFQLPDEREAELRLKRTVCEVFRDENRIVTQAFTETPTGRRRWAPTVSVYYRADPPTMRVNPAAIGLPAKPRAWREIEGIRPVDKGPAGLKALMQRLGDRGLVGVWLTGSGVLQNEAMIYDYYDHPRRYRALAARRIETVERRFAALMALEVKPDFFCVGGSGTLVFQTPAIFRELALPAVKRACELACAAGIPTHMHSCGPETALVEIMALETRLTVIDPLEIPPMGDCDLAALKRRFGNRLTLKGNLHTTEVMLKGAPADVVRASQTAMDAAATGGRFILSTGDQCGRDTPDANLHAMVRTARTYGRYRTDGTLTRDTD